MLPIAFDVETFLVEPGCLAPRIVCGAFCAEGETVLVHHTELSGALSAVLESGRVIVGHNVAFDMACVITHYPEHLSAVFGAYDRDKVTCTMVRQKLLDISSSRRRKLNPWPSLADCVRKYFGYELAKEDTWRLRYGELYDLPLCWWPDEARQYPKDDVLWDLRVWAEQENRSRLLEDEYRQARAALWLQLISVHGLMTDTDRVEKLATALQMRESELRARLVEAGLMRKGGSRDTKAARRRMFEVCQRAGTDVPWTASGEALHEHDRVIEKHVSLSADACKATNDPVMRAYAEVSSVGKRLSTEIPMLRQGLVQMRWNTILETGRTSSRPPQNQPKEGGIRECFVPRPGHVFAAADYDAFELHTFTQVCIWLGIESKLAKVLNAGEDPHIHFIAVLLQSDYATVLAKYKAGDSEIKRLRNGTVGNGLAKVCNYGLLGGMGADRLVEHAKANGLELSRDEAQSAIEVHRTTWPEVPEYFRWVSGLVGGYGGTTDCEQFRSGRWRGGCYYTEACNTYFQGLAADAAKAAGWLLCRRCYDPTQGSALYGSRPVHFLHDENIIEVVDDEHAHAKAMALAATMREGADAFLPDVPARASGYLMRRWSKNAKAVYSNGRLTPWDE